MKNIISCVLLLLVISPIVAQKLEKIWETPAIFKVPESVLYDNGEDVLFISNIDGASGEKDGKGHISKVSKEGKMISLEWVIGLNAPKGMATFGNMLYVADVDAIISIEKKTGNIISKTTVPGAKFLNDLTADDNGTLYFSDSETGIIHEMKQDKAPEVFISGRTRPNGVYFYDGRLYFADAGALYTKDTDGTILELAKGMERSTDGIEPINDNLFLMSAWVGEIYLVNLNGEVTILLSSKNEKINSADIGFDRKNSILYVPTFSDNRVVAYKVVL
jgi:sugar lactone lactonase YvrE